VHDARIAIVPLTSVYSDEQSDHFEHATNADKRRAHETNTDSALALAFSEAAKAGRFDVVAQIAKELEARRLDSSNVVSLHEAKRGTR
jgi:hypothetical protein